MPDGTVNTGIGASVKRIEDQRFLTGKGNYTDDINRPDQTYAYMLRSPHSHAKIITIDSSTAEASDGVVAIFTGEDEAPTEEGLTAALENQIANLKNPPIVSKVPDSWLAAE